MKILHVLYSGLGGHGNVFFSMVKGDVNNEIEYEALFYGIEDVRQEYIEQSKENNIKYYLAKKKLGFDFNYYKSILHFIKESNPDIVFLHGSAYILLTRIASFFSKKNYKIVVRETQANHLKTKAQWVTLAISMFLADTIVCLTKEFAKEISNKLKLLFRKNKIIVISNGIDLNKFKIEKKIEKNSEFNIGMQSRIVSIKDYTTLLKAFAIVKKIKNNSEIIKLKIAGDGDLKTQLILLSKQLGIENDVIFTGMLNERDLIFFLQSLDLYVHASLGETMSTAIMQAMACGLPIIASDVNGINNMVTNGDTGILVPAKNEILLSEAILNCINDIKLRNTLSNNGYNYALNNFSNQIMFKIYNNKVFIK